MPGKNHGKAKNKKRLKQSCYLFNNNTSLTKFTLPRKYICLKPEKTIIIFNLRE